MDRAPRLLRSLLVAGFASAGALAGGAAAGADRSRASSPSLEDELRQVSSAVGGLRGRSFVHEVPTRTMSCSSASLRLLEIARAEGARCSPDIERAVVALGFLGQEHPPDAPAPAPAPPVPAPGRLADEDDDAAHPCGLAFYDQIRKEVVVVEGRSSPDERSEVLAHELSHALQDQHFDLRAKLRAIPRTLSGDHDAEDLAVNASINEGEATAIELLFLWKNGADRSLIQGVALEDTLGDVARLFGIAAPPERSTRAGMRSILKGSEAAWNQQRRLGAHFYFHALARFQYVVGCRFVAEAYRRGGWPLVDRLRTMPPSSTTQLLHPEKFFDEPELPLTVGPSGFLGTLGDRARLLYENRLGELGTMVATEGDVPGWRGDNYRVLSRADGSTVVEARSLWESPAAALHFVSRSSRWLRSMSLSQDTFDVVERRAAAVVLGAGLRKHELRAFRAASWDEERLAGPAPDRTVGLRRRGADGAVTCELRILEPGEREKAIDVLKAHVDRGARGCVDTDGSSWGLRQRPGGGVSWVEDRKDGRIVVATALDRAAVDATREALLLLAPLKEPKEKKDR